MRWGVLVGRVEPELIATTGLVAGLFLVHGVIRAIANGYSDTGDTQRQAGS